MVNDTEDRKNFIKYKEKYHTTLSKFIKTKDFLRNLMDTAPITISLVSSKGIYLGVNNHLSSLIGFPKEDIVGKNIGFLGKDDMFPDFIESIFSSNTIIHKANHQVEKKGEDAKFFQLIARKFDLSRNAVIVGVDISDYKIAELKIQQITLRLLQAQKLSTIGELTAGILHELTQPLSVIKLAAHETMRDIKNNQISMEKLKEDMQCIISVTNKMSDIVDNMLCYSRKSENDCKKIDLNNVIESALLLIDHDLHIKNFKVVKDFDPNLPKISTNQIKIEQALLNIIINARDAVEEYRKKDREITIKSYLLNHGSRKVVIEIQDNGGGMSDKVKQKILEPFFTTKKIGKGTGIGLSITNRIINECNGKIEYETQENIGTVFRLIFPA